MTRLLVTGGTGVLGRAVVTLLSDAGEDVRVLSRRALIDAERGSSTTMQGDLTTGAGLMTALDGVETVIHCASSPARRTRATDVDGTQRLVKAARMAGVRHLVYISIVGIDRIPLPYYKAKLDAERAVRTAGPPWSIVRATQFHSLLRQGLRLADKLPVVPILQGMKFQPIAPVEVAARLVAVAAGSPTSRIDEMGGPQIRSLHDITRAYLRATGSHRPTVPVLYLPGKAARAFRQGANLAPDHAEGVITWEDYLETTFSHR